MAKVLSAPKGEALYPRLGSPDTKFDADGTYHVKMKYDTDNEQIAAFTKQIDVWYDEAIAEAIAKVQADHKEKTGNDMSDKVAAKKVKLADKPYSFIEDDEGEDTNFIVINFKMKAKAKNRKTGEEFELKPAIFGAGRDALEGKQIPSIYSGSVLKVGYTPQKWFTSQLGASVRLRLEAVKIIDLVSSAKGNADNYDFGDDDEGYVPPTGDAAAAFAGDDDTPAKGDDDGTGDF